MDNKIKWGCIQPLTGGMYIGAKEAIGHDAEWIISYPGTNSTKYDKNGNVTSVGNEYNLTQWLKKNNCMVPYFTFSHRMFEDVNLDEVELTLTDGPEQTSPNFTDLDIVLAVPVCSGLSMVTTASETTKDTRNCNMLFLAKYTLSVIQPKVYIFENAPTLMGTKGDEVRNKLEEIALANKYSLLYYKTDTVLHDNCQVRPRTFVIFQKWETESQEPFTLDFQNNTIDLMEYLNRIPVEATQQIPFKLSPLNIALLEFSKQKYGENWRNISHKRPMIDLVNTNDYDSFIECVKNMNTLTEAEKNKLYKFIDHVQYKKSLGLNFMSIDIIVPKKTVPSIQFKCIYSILHPIEDRLLTVRECLHFMGMPNDFELLGNIELNYAQIGQNVPVKTAKFIVDQVVKHMYDTREVGSNVKYINNIKQTIEKI